jgi:hypothetical protein
MRTFIFISTTAAATIFASPVCSQQPSQGSASIPDFSGIWAHLSCCGFELPLSGPGPVTNRSYPYRVGDYTNPILKPEAAEIVRRRGEISLSGIPVTDPGSQCWPGGVPFIFWNTGIQILQQQHQITILYSNDHEVRHVRMNQPHPAQVTPSWYGDSVGHYEGDTLVIDTVGIRIGPFATVDQYGTPHTKALHVVERYRLIDYEATIEAEERDAKVNRRLQQSDAGFARDPDYKGKGLSLQFTVEDDGVFTMPWHAGVTYRRPLGGWPEMVCAENLRATYITKDSDVPKADRPDF